jgi:hypothetical protein
MKILEVFRQKFDERYKIECARRRRLKAIQSRIQLIRYREEFRIFDGWGRGNPRCSR